MVKEQRDVERGTTDDGKYRERDTEPLIEKDVVGGNTEGSISISLLSTAVAVLGSFQYGLCVSKFRPLPVFWDRSRLFFFDFSIGVYRLGIHRQRNLGLSTNLIFHFQR